MVSNFLTCEDIDYLNGNGYTWELPVPDEGKRGLIVKGYHLPTGYQPEETDLMLLIPPNYPIGALDMFYFSPSILRADLRRIDALAPETHFGIEWQRWSRHYHNEWRPGIDGIATHITFVGNQLKSELGLP